MNYEAAWNEQRERVAMWAKEYDELADRYRQREKQHAALVEAARIKDAKIKALESTIELLRKGMVESCRDDRQEVMGGCVYAAELTKAARAVVEGVTTGDFGHSDELITALRAALENGQ